MTIELLRSRWLRPLAFSNGQALPHRLLPGPMEGVSEGSFVELMSRRGLVAAWHTPFLRISTGVPRRSRLQLWLAPYLATGLPVIAQLMGVDSDRLAVTTARLHDLGVACVDLNCACPSAMVIRNQAGGARLKQPEWIAKTVLAMREASDGRPVSVKIRCGFADPAELPDIASALRCCEPDLVCCHFRTVKEMYQPVQGGWERLRQLRQLLSQQILFGAGDLFTVEDALRMGMETGVDGITPARGLMKNPGLLREIEAALGGQSYSPMTREDKQEFLRELGEKSGMPPEKRGFVIQMAKAMQVISG